MTTETINGAKTAALDSALSELVQLKWTWEYEDRSAQTTRRIEELTRQLESQGAGVYADCAVLLRKSMAGARPLSRMMLAKRKPPNPDAETATPLSPVEELVAALPVDFDKVQESDVPSLLARASQAPASTESTALEAPVRLPVRNATATDASHVRLFTEYGGLVHGGVISIGKSRLVCRAFSYFRHTSDRPLLGPGQTQRVHVVAGVCEQFDPAGKVVQRWSTAEKLQDVYQSTSQALPDQAWRVRNLLGTGEGFYEAPLTPDATRNLFKTIQGSGYAPIADSGTPNAKLYSGSDFFGVSPGPDSALENALYRGQGSASSGWVINTPYLSVFSPSPQLSTVIVAMVGVYREASWTTRGKPFKKLTTRMDRFTRKAQWSVRSFQLPLGD